MKWHFFVLLSLNVFYLVSGVLTTNKSTGSPSHTPCPPILNHPSISSHPLTIQFCYIQSIPSVTFCVSETILLGRDNYTLDDIEMNGYIPGNVWFSHGLLKLVHVLVSMCVFTWVHTRESENGRERGCVGEDLVWQNQSHFVLPRASWLGEWA